MQDLEFRQFIERVKLRTPIEVVIGERVSGLKQKGVLYWACCPFHQEKTPSFAVDPRRATWRCFGACGEGGDVLSFVQRFDGLSFLETLRLLAQQCGEELPERELRGRARGQEAELEERLDCLRWAMDFYREAWRSPEGSLAREYMHRRGLATGILETFGVGWASASGQALVTAAVREGKPIEHLLETGLARKNESGRPYDFFRGRVLIPIRDRLGRVVAFGGRILGSTEDGPKYVNTPETSVFHKGRLIFGLDLATPSLRTRRQLLVVEGYTDVMAAHQAGWTNAVAVLGTATTEDHAALVRRTGVREVVLVFDGDEAGRKAGLKALSGLLKLPVSLRVAALPEGRDPGDLLVDPAGAREFAACIEAAQEWFDWCLGGLREKRGAELTRAVEERFGLIQRLEKPLERSARLVEIARFLALPEADVRAQWVLYERSQRPTPSPAPEAPRPPRQGAPASDRMQHAYALLLGALLSDNSLVPLYAHLVSGCPEGELAVLFRKLLELYERDESGAPLDASALMTALGDDPSRGRAVAFQALAEEAESPAVLARDQARWIERTRAERGLEALKGLLARPVPEPEDELATLERLHAGLRAVRVPSAAVARSQILTPQESHGRES